MRLRLTSPTGHIIVLNAVQAVILTDNGDAVAYAADLGKDIVFDDARNPDWSGTVQGLGLNPPEVER